jgi:hypothetical protein
MSNRNFDSNLIIRRQRDLNDANNFYKTQQEGRNIITHPQNTDTSLQRILNFKTGSQTFYFKNEIGGDHMISLGAIANLLGDKKEETIVVSQIPPSPPFFLNATIISPTEVSISFVPGNSGSSEIINYQYSFDNWVTIKDFNPPVTSSPVIISSLELGKTYNIKLRSLSSYTYSESSSISFIMAVAPQSAPIMQSFVEQNTSLSLFILQPLNIGGAPIIGYEYSIDNVTYTDINTVINNNVHNIIIPNLTNGTQYTVYIRAKNEKGVSPSVQIIATPSTTPTAPLNLTATSYNQYITLNWAQPSQSGGAEIIEYQIYSNNSLVTTVSGTTFTYNSTGLVNGTSYEFYIIARNKNGISPQSNKVSETPSTTPDTPTLIYSVADNNSAYIYFTNGSSNGGSIITSYQYTLDNGATFLNLDSTQLLSPLKISGLINGILSTIKIRAVNIKGPSTTWSNEISVTPSSGTLRTALIIINANNSLSYKGNNSTSVTSIGTDTLITGTLSSTPAGVPTVGYIMDSISGRYIFDFDGTSYINFNTNTDFGNAFTVTAWIYPRDKNSTNLLFSNGNSGNSQPGFKLGWNTGGTNNKELSFEGVNTSGVRTVTVSPNNTLELNTWHHVAYVFNKTNNIVLFYKNGIPVSMTNISTVSNIPTLNSTFTIGGATNFNNLMNARLGYLRVFNAELNAPEVYTDFSGARSQFKV